MPNIVDLVRNHGADSLALTKVWLRSEKRCEFGSGEVSRLWSIVGDIWAGYDERLASIEENPFTLWKSGRCVQKIVGGTQPGETVQRRTSEHIDKAIGNIEGNFA